MSQFIIIIITILFFFFWPLTQHVEVTRPGIKPMHAPAVTRDIAVTELDPYPARP